MKVLGARQDCLPRRTAPLLSIMAGLDRPEKGQVLLNGTDLAGMDLDAYRRQDVSVIFQAFQLFPLLTVMEDRA